jgi:O-methyltransferase domain/Dimerisation domain
VTTTIDTVKPEQAKALSDLPPPMAMLRFLGGFRIARIMYVVAELGIADLLADGPKTIAELAQATETHQLSLYRVLRALASVGIFAEDETGKFRLTPSSEFLQADSPNSLKASVILFGQDWHWETWGELLYSIKTGEPAFDHLYGMGLFEFFQKPQICGVAQESKTSISYRATQSLLDNYDFSRADCVVQLGCFSGVKATLIPLLEANPELTGICLDFPTAIENDCQVVQATGMLECCKLVAGDCTESVPPGGDIYLLLFVVHNWDDKGALKILQNCRQRMTPQAKLLLVESIMPLGNDPFIGKLIDIQSLLTTPGGYERTESEYRSLLSRAGFDVTKIIPTQTSNSIIEAVVSTV